MLSVSPQVAVWLGIVLVAAALTAAQIEGQKQGHTLIGDLQQLFLGGNP